MCTELPKVALQFGSTTRAINGRLECTPNGKTNKARKRWSLFNKCLQANGERRLVQKEGTGLGSIKTGFFSRYNSCMI